MTKTFNLVKLDKNVSLPTRGTNKSAGLDLSASERVVIPGLSIEKGVQQALVSTGLSISVPKGYYGRIAPRSGFSVKKITDIGAGVIDEDYTGELKILVRNLSSSPLFIEVNDKIAQLIFEKIGYFKPKEVTELVKTERGSGGFGSTDKV